MQMDLPGQRPIGAVMSLGLGDRYLQYGCHVARKCPYCGKLISTQYARHLKTHTDYKPYMCCICPARFTRMDHLKRHTRNIHNTDLETLASQSLQATASGNPGGATLENTDLGTLSGENRQSTPSENVGSAATIQGKDQQAVIAPNVAKSSESMDDSTSST